MRNPIAKFWPKVLLGLAACSLIVILRAQADGAESVREELVRLQREYGLTFAWTDRGVRAVSFDTRAVVDLEDSLQAFRPNAFTPGNYPEVSGIGTCWSHDQRRLVSTMINRSTGNVSLAILDLNSEQTRPFAIHVDQRPYVTSQCWAPDDKKIIYETDGSVRLYDVENDRSNAIAKGTDPTWSPDGNWIAFRDGETYYAIHPDESGRKELFHNRWGKAVSALYWSPDSRIVAYVRELGFLQGGALDAEVNQLRVRRLDDGSEDRLSNDSVNWYADYHWITSSRLMNHSETESNRTK
jgi:WD40-like Beta Propeller Repeat